MIEINVCALKRKRAAEKVGTDEQPELIFVSA
jgi:hypothetical protein